MTEHDFNLQLINKLGHVFVSEIRLKKSIDNCGFSLMIYDLSQRLKFIPYSSMLCCYPPLTSELMDAEHTYVGYFKLPFFHPQIS